MSNSTNIFGLARPQLDQGSGVDDCRVVGRVTEQSRGRVHGGCAAVRQPQPGRRVRSNGQRQRLGRPRDRRFPRFSGIQLAKIISRHQKTGGAPVARQARAPEALASRYSQLIEFWEGISG